MFEALNEDNLRDHLTAFADGELDAPQSLAVWQYLAEHPERAAALKWLADQQALTLAAKRALQIQAPSDLRDRIATLAAAVPVAEVETPESAMMFRPITANVPQRNGRRVLWTIGSALALAAAVAIGVTIAPMLSASRTVTTPVTDVIPASTIVDASEIHAYCSRLPTDLHDKPFEAVNAPLADLTKSDLKTANYAPDLTAIGFRFIGAGPCSAREIKTVHLLYKTARPQSLSAVSVFVQADTGQFSRLTIGRVYRTSAPTSPFPMLAWRTGKVVYFLLADNDETESKVLQHIHPMPADQIITAVSN